MYLNFDTDEARRRFQNGGNGKDKRKEKEPEGSHWQSTVRSLYDLMRQ